MKKLLLTLMLTVMSVMAGMASVVLNSTNFPDAVFRAYISSITGVAEGGMISDAQLQSVTFIDVDGKGITSLKGVDYFTALTTLHCRSNKLTSLDVSHNTALTWLFCYDNQLSTLDVSHNTALWWLYCYNNQLTSLDVSHNTALRDLYCYNNQLTSLDVSGATMLIGLYCNSNQLTSLDVSHNTKLAYLECGNNQLTSLDVSHNTSLRGLYCYSNQLTSLDVSHNTALTTLQCSGNQLTSLDVSQNTALKELSCSSNQLPSLDVSQDTALTYLDCSANQLSSLDVSHNTALTTLKCYNNQLMSLDLSKCTKLQLESTSVSSQSKSMVASPWGSNHYSIDVPADFYISKVYSFKVNSVSVTPTLSNGQLVFTSSSTPTSISYQYDTSNSVAGTMGVSVSVTYIVDGTTSYDLTISATGNGSVSYSGTSIRNKSQTFSVVEGTNATITFTPDTGYRIKSVKVGSTDVTSNVKNNQYTVSNIEANKTVTVVFEEKIITVDGVTYNILSAGNKQLKVVLGTIQGDYVLPETVAYDNTTWTVTAIDGGAFTDCAALQSLEIPATVTTVGKGLFAGCRHLGAVVWNPAIALTEAMLEGVSNPNLLLYVTSKRLAPASVHNIIVNGAADDIILADADGGNDFHCPRSFTAAAITYSHRYGMTSGIGECRGWETLALPFDVQAISYGSAKLVPFSVWDGGKSSKPFWLYRLFEGQGFIPDASVRKNVPYIISMPNNEAYDASYNISGVVTFSGYNTTVEATTAMTGPTHNGKTFVPTYSELESGGTVYALNVNNQLGNHAGAFAEGSVFTSTPVRTVHPFEAYMLVKDSQAKTYFSLFDDLPTKIEQPDTFGMKGNYVICHLSGQMVRRMENVTFEEAVHGLRGVYLVNGRKVVLK